VTVLMICCAVTIAGSAALFSLPVALLPALSPPVLTVTASAPHLPAEQVREAIALPLEKALSSVRGLRRISSISRRGLCVLRLGFSWGKCMNAAAGEAREAIGAVRRTLPLRTALPRVLPFDPADEAVLRVGIFSDRLSAVELRRAAERRVAPALRRVTGVSTVTISGGREEEVRLYIDQELLSAVGVTPEAAAAAVADANRDVPVGLLREGNRELIVKVDGRAETLTGLEQIDVLGARPGSGPLHLGSFAEVKRALKPRTSIFRHNGRSGVCLDLRSRPEASPIAVSKAVRQQLEELQRGSGTQLEMTVVRDRAPLAVGLLRSLALSAGLGGAAAFAVLLLTFRHLKTALIVVTAVPLSLAGALTLLLAGGFSLNTMSLGGLALAIGMIVDNAVVVLERLEREERVTAVAAAAAETARATWATTLTSAAAFLPLLLLPGLAGALFADLAFSVITAILISYPVAVTFVPVLHVITGNYRACGMQAPGRRSALPVFSRIRSLYARLLGCFLRRPAICVLLLVIPLLAALFLAPRVPRELLPHTANRRIATRLTFPPGCTLKAIGRASEEIEQLLLRCPLVLSVTCSAGGGLEDPGYLTTIDSTPEQLRISCRTAAPADEHCAARINRLISTAVPPGCKIRTFPEDELFGRLLPLAEGDRRLRILGSSPEEALRNGKAMAEVIEQETGLSPLLLPRAERPQLLLFPDRQRLSSAGLSPAAVAEHLSAGLTGTVVSEMHQAGKRLDIRMMLPPEYGRSISALDSILLPLREGKRLPLHVAAARHRRLVPSLLPREDRRDVVYLDLPGTQALPADLLDTVAAMPAPEGSSGDAAWAETAEHGRTEERRNDILQLLLFSLFLLYVLLGAQFDSLVLPFLLICSVIPGTLGLVGGLLAAGQSINAASSLALLVLLGVAVNSAVLQVDEYRRRIAAGAPAAGAVYRGSIVRLRPILLTAATTCTALLPIAIEAAGPSLQSGIAAASAGALLAAALLSPCLVPPLFLGYQAVRARCGGCRPGRRRVRGTCSRKLEVPRDAA
jgi:HAE1 family hydrophobic/amphiphilic exporter-1